MKLRNNDNDSGTTIVDLADEDGPTIIYISDETIYTKDDDRHPDNQ